MPSAHEDIANARIRFANGAVATITASRIAARTERRMRIFARDGYMAADFANRRLTVVGRGRGKPVPGVADFGMEEIVWEDHDSLAAEHAAFVASVLDGAPVVVDAAAGRRALEAALAVGEAHGAIAARRMAASGLIEQPQHGLGRGVRWQALGRRAAAASSGRHGGALRRGRGGIEQQRRQRGGEALAACSPAGSVRGPPRGRRSGSGSRHSGRVTSRRAIAAVTGLTR